MVKNWNNITVEQAEKIFEAVKIDGEAEKLASLLSIVLEVEEEEVYNYSMSKIEELVKKHLSFLGEKVKPELVKEEYEVNGNVYCCPINAQEIPICQFIDLSSVLDKQKPFHVILSCILVPKGHSYNDGYNLEKVMNDMKALPFHAANDMCFFFRKVARAYSKASLSYSIRKMKSEMKKTKDKQKKKILSEAIKKSQEAQKMLG